MEQKSTISNKYYIILENDIYDVSGYLFAHPGEYIHNITLRDYRNIDATQEFNCYHYTETPYELLNEAKTKGSCCEGKVKYVCPNIFDKRIPWYFHYTDLDVIEKVMDDKTFVVTYEKDDVVIIKKVNDKIEKEITKLRGAELMLHLENNYKKNGYVGYAIKRNKEN
jgi:hypothetical protein